MKAITKIVMLPVAVLVLFTVPEATALDDPAAAMSRYNVVWESPSKDATGVMPIGNGDIAAGVYAIGDGDLYLLLSKNDAFNFSGELYKTGRVRVSLDPNPFAAGKPFRQTLDLPTGSIGIEADGVKLRIWADAHRNLYHVEIESPRELRVTVTPEHWQRLDGTEDVRLEREGKIISYFAVGDRSTYPQELAGYGVTNMMTQFPDPYRFNTFGYLLEPVSSPGRRFDIRIHSLAMQTPQPADWIQALENQAQQPVELPRDWQAHCAWWKAFWERSWIAATDHTLPPEERETFSHEPGADGMRAGKDGAALVSQNYNVFRFLMACQSRGRMQTKFNGGLFTQQERIADAKFGWHKKPAMKEVTRDPAAYRQEDGTWLTHEDDRLWWRRFTFQNQRLLYWPLLASGDADLMRPFFDFYRQALPMRKAITQAWFGHAGAFFRENMMPTGVDVDNNGNPPKTKPGEPYTGSYHHYYFTSGLELIAMMIEHFKFTGDAVFRDQVLVPHAREVLKFFDLHYPRDAQGKLRLDPAQVIETWWIAVNPAPDIAGLRYGLDELLAGGFGTADDQREWKRFRAEIPEIPMQTIAGRLAIAPAEKWEKKHNLENGELYPVFPFQQFGIGMGSEAIVAATIDHATEKRFKSRCWAQNEIFLAYAGRADAARDELVARFRLASATCRFPLYGREGPDSCPDFDHFGSGAIAFQKMLVQEAQGRIFLLPAWPREWDVDFKLHVSGGAVVTGTVRNGKLMGWDIMPGARKKDVVVVGVAAVAVEGAAEVSLAGRVEAEWTKFVPKAID